MAGAARIGRMDLTRDLLGRERYLLAANKSATLTLGEMKDFIARLEAEGAERSSPMLGKATFWRGRLLAVTATIVRSGG